MSFDFNVAQLFSPLLVLVVGWLVKVAKDSVIRHMDENRDRMHAIAEERHKENVVRFDRIEEQTTRTNGKVADLELRMTKEEAKTELLTEIYLKGKAE